MIPQKIHYCWFGQHPQSDLNKRCLDSWHRVLPDYQIKLWDETNVPLDTAYARAAYAAGAWSRLSNHVRLHALYNEGGIYLDTDVEVRKDFVPLLQHECFVGFQQAEEQVDWVNSAVLGAQPGHPFLARCARLTQDLFASNGEFPRSPLVVTRVLKEMGLRDYKLQEIKGVTIYPVEYFYPYPWFGNFSPDCIKENTYCIHYWEGSWRKPEQRRILSPRRIMKRMLRAFG
ncbi:MAG TPA: glycosyltransferase [Pyrinomonadaceae bacterium]|jgi:mannosyltransferase OCH1-like enzyme|nr:glycosyltransferase [Pyrinomonadaceae bacterium]